MLRRTAARDDPGALAARGLALAALDELEDSLATLERARVSFVDRGDRRSALRCRAAMVEIAVFRRDLEDAEPAIRHVVAELDALGDRPNAAWMRVVGARLAVLLGRGRDALATLEEIGAERVPAATRAVALLAAGEQALRGRRAALAADLFAAAAAQARGTHPALQAEVERARATLAVPVAEWTEQGRCALVDASTLEALAAPRVMGGARRWLVDGLRGCVVTPDGACTSLAGRPVLLSLAVALGREAPAPADWHALAAAAFGTSRPNETHRARLKVELGRLRRVLPPALSVASSGRGAWAMVAKDGGAIAHPARVGAERALTMLADGRAWRTAEIAAALGVSARTAQRELSALRDRGLVQVVGAGPRSRWRAPDRSETIASQMLLLGLMSEA